MPRIPFMPDGSPAIPQGLSPEEATIVKNRFATPRAGRGPMPRTRLTYGDDSGAGPSDTSAWRGDDDDDDDDDDATAAAAAAARPRPRGRSVAEQAGNSVWDQLGVEEMVAEGRRAGLSDRERRDSV